MRLCFFPRLQRVCAADSPRVYLQWVLGADGQDLVLEVAELAAPGASLADPADEAGLMGAAHRAVTAAGAQQLALQDTKETNTSKCLLILFSTAVYLLKLFEIIWSKEMGVKLGGGVKNKKKYI